MKDRPRSCSGRSSPLFLLEETVSLHSTDVELDNEVAATVLIPSSYFTFYSCFECRFAAIHHFLWFPGMTSPSSLMVPTHLQPG